MTQPKFEDHCRPETWLGKAEMPVEILIADADGVHIGRSIQRRPAQHRLELPTVKELCGTPWKMLPNKTKLVGRGSLSQKHHVGSGAETRSPSWMQVVSRFAWRTLGCVHIEFRAHLGGRRLNQGYGGGGEGCEASQLERNDDGESVGVPTSEWNIGQFKSTSSSGKFIISG